MTDKTAGSTPRYIAPLTKVLRVTTRTNILQSSIGGTPGLNDYEKGSDSAYGFGDDDE